MESQLRTKEEFAALARRQQALGNLSTSSYDQSPGNFRIGPEAFTASIFTFLALAVILAATRIILRVRAFHRLHSDDYFMIAAVTFFIASTGVTQACRDLNYLQLSVVTGAILPDFTFPEKMLLYNKYNVAQYILQWSCIFSVKFSYIFFFRPLTSRIRRLRIWWYTVVGLMVPLACITTFLAPWVCPYFDMSFYAKCVLSGEILIREHTILQISTGTDIATDLLIISIPVWLLTSVHLELKRKLALGAVLCLSIFMIIIAILRYTLCSITLEDGRSIPDTIWLFFWQSIESCVAIIMVSLTAFRSLYGQERAKRGNRRGEYEYVDEDSAARSRRRRAAQWKGEHSGSGGSGGGGSKNRTMVGNCDDQEDKDVRELNVIAKVSDASMYTKHSRSMERDSSDSDRNRMRANALV